MLDKEKCLRNIDMMVDKAKRNNVRLRPHFKTHQSAQVGEWFRERGVEAITVSSLRMAQYFARHGWTDIMVAIPVNLREIDLVNKLASQVKLNLVAVNPETVEALEQQLVNPVHLWVKIDTGYHRTGLRPDDHSTLDQVMNAVKNSEKLNFTGFLAHDGHTYKQTEKEAILAIHNTTVNLLHLMRDRYLNSFPNLQLSIGDTPSCSVLETIKGVDEIRPGNYVFYDLTQQHIGSCTYEQIAVCMACPVIAKHPDRSEIILYGGSVHFSKDVLPQENGPLFGRVVELTEKGWSLPVEGIQLVSLSQEHGVVRANAEQFKKYKIGDLMYILPVHSCLTADVMKSYLTLDGERLEHLSGVPAQV